MARWEMQGKYWEIQVESSKVTQRWGKNGAPPTVSAKQTASADEAKALEKKLVAEREKKGWAKVGREVDLEDIDALLVHADELTAAGDQRGELINLHHRLETTKGPAAKKLKAQAKAIEDGLLPNEAAEERVELEWRRGYLWKIWSSGFEETDDDLDERIIKALLGHPSARYLHELGVGDIEGDSDHEYAPIAKIIAALAPKTLKRLYIGVDDWQWTWSFVSVGALSGKLPNLESLTVVGGSPDLGKAVFPNLVELTVKTGNGDLGSDIGKGTYPRMERLELWFGQGQYYACTDAASCKGILAGKGLPKLTHLGLCNNEFTDELVKMIVKSPILPRLKSLDLSKGTLGDEGLATLIAARDKLAHLEKLDLSENFIADTAAAKAIKGPKIAIGEQKSVDEEERYASAGE
jgi:predicted DNA-binding WGR domain protein